MVVQRESCVGMIKVMMGVTGGVCAGRNRGILLGKGPLGVTRKRGGPRMAGCAIKELRVSRGGQVLKAKQLLVLGTVYLSRYSTITVSSLAVTGSTTK